MRRRGEGSAARKLTPSEENEAILKPSSDFKKPSTRAGKGANLELVDSDLNRDYSSKKLRGKIEEVDREQFIVEARAALKRVQDTPYADIQVNMEDETNKEVADRMKGHSQYSSSYKGSSGERFARKVQAAHTEDLLDGQIDDWKVEKNIKDFRRKIDSGQVDSETETKKRTGEMDAGLEIVTKDLKERAYAQKNRERYGSAKLDARPGKEKKSGIFKRLLNKLIGK